MAEISDWICCVKEQFTSYTRAASIVDIIDWLLNSVSGSVHSPCLCYVRCNALAEAPNPKALNVT